jgi:hypothetical protein
MREIWPVAPEIWITVLPPCAFGLHNQELMTTDGPAMTAHAIDTEAVLIYMAIPSTPPAYNL